MLPLVVLVASLSLTSATRATHAVSLAQCVRGCEAKNECHTSLESLSCEASCQAVCKCASISRRVLNKPKHCMSSMLEEHHKRLALFRLGHPRMKKVVLNDDQAKPDFASFVPLEDFWPHGHTDQAEEEEESKPVRKMLNSHAELSLLRKDAMPWSPEHRSLGSRSKHHHHHKHHNAALLSIHKNVTKTEMSANVTKQESAKQIAANASTSSKVVSVKTKVVAVKNGTTGNASATSKVVTPTNAKLINATTPAKVVTPANTTAPAKVAAPSNSSKATAPVKVAEPAKKK